MNKFKKGDDVKTSIGITGHISKVVVSKESGKPFMYVVALDEPIEKGITEIAQCAMQMELIE